MKTTKMRLVAMLITLAAVVTGFNAEAQRRDSRSHRETPQNERNYQARKGQSHAGQKADKHFKSNQGHQGKNERAYQAGRNYRIEHSNRYWDRDDHGRYAERHWDNHFKYDRRYEYDHPRYGHVYRRFSSSPIRLKYNQGNIFFFAGNYYRYYRGVGYVRIAIPRDVVFYDLPFQCELVRVGPRVYYRHGDMVFERYNHGYRLAPSIDIRLSAHF